MGTVLAVALTLGDAVDCCDETEDTDGAMKMGGMLALNVDDGQVDVLTELVGSCVTSNEANGDGLLNCVAIEVEVET